MPLAKLVLIILEVANVEVVLLTTCGYQFCPVRCVHVLVSRISLQDILEMISDRTQPQQILVRRVPEKPHLVEIRARVPMHKAV